MKKPHAATLFGAAVLFFVAVGILQEPAHEMAGGPRSESLHNIGTFSIVALDPDNGDLQPDEPLPDRHRVPGLT